MIAPMIVFLYKSVWRALRVSDLYTHSTAQHKRGRNANISHSPSLCPTHGVCWLLCWHPCGTASCAVPNFSSELFPLKRSMDVRDVGNGGLINEKRMNRLNCWITFYRLYTGYCTYFPLLFNIEGFHLSLAFSAECSV